MPPTKLTRDDAYEEMGSIYQLIQIDALNKALKENGIADAAARKSICEHFIFTMSNFHDQCWMEAEGQPRVYPLLAFSTGSLRSEQGGDELGEVYLQPEYFAFHEYAFGNCGYYFDEHGEDLGDITTGVG